MKSLKEKSFGLFLFGGDGDHQAVGFLIENVQILLQLILAAIPTGRDHFFIPDIGLGVADHYGGLHTNLAGEHICKRSEGDGFIVTGGSSDNTHRGFGIAVFEKYFLGNLDLFSPFF